MDTTNQIRLLRNTKKVINKKVIDVKDDDTAPQQIRYNLQSIIGSTNSYIESSLKPATKLTQFTQHDVNRNIIYFVHKPDVNTPKAAATDDIIKLVFSINDGQVINSIEAIVEVTAFALKLVEVHNTGLILEHDTAVLITSSNLTYTTNNDTNETESGPEIRYEVGRCDTSTLSVVSMPSRINATAIHFALGGESLAIWPHTKEELAKGRRVVQHHPIYVETHQQE